MEASQRFFNALMQTLILEYHDPAQHSIRFTAVARWRWLARWNANRHRINWLRSRGLPKQFLTYVRETWY